ncbi:MAG: hypothetical protein CM1200mP2_16640 [Planctomycetaceae bacterium]|nr:MAG: hypothetical protein CM1200mP2_16640 [Planctomycetaceae bacterium]
MNPLQSNPENRALPDGRQGFKLNRTSGSFDPVDRTGEAIDENPNRARIDVDRSACEAGGAFYVLALWILSGVSPSRVAAEPADGRPLDVRTFGARGDGVADDTAAVHAGIAAAVNSGRTLLIPKGTYLVGKPIR